MTLMGNPFKIGTAGTIMQNQVLGSVFTAPISGRLLHIIAYIVNSLGSNKAKAAVYRTADQVLIGQTTELTLVAPVDTWVLFPFAVRPDVVSGTQYTLVAAGDNNFESLAGSTGGAGAGRAKAEAYATLWPDPAALGPTTDLFSIFANFEDSAWLGMV